MAYKIVELNGPKGFGSGAAAINSSGDVTGWYSTLVDLAEPMGFIYSQGNVSTLPNLGFAITLPSAINDSGEVAGLGFINANEFHAFRYSNGNMTDLGTLGGANSEAADINNSGVVVGKSDTGNGKSRAFLYAKGQMTDLGTLGGSNSEANGINNNGQITGMASTAGDNDTHAFRTAPNAAIAPKDDLGTLGFIYSKGLDINDSGQVAGESRILPSAIIRAFLTDPNKSIDPQDDLGSLGGAGDVSFAAAVNNSGEVVGNDGTGVPVLFTAGTIIDLNMLLPANSGWVLQVAVDINDAGWIVGNGTLNGDKRGFLLIPPPPVTPPWLTQVAEEVQILFGVTNDGGGAIILPNGVIIHVPPGGPGDPVFQNVARVLPEVLEGIVVRQIGQMSKNAKARNQIKNAGLNMARTAIEKLLHLLRIEEQ